MYPMKLVPVYKERIWGGNKLALNFGRTLPSGKVGESWELCCHRHGMSVVGNGPLAGMTLLELMKTEPQKLIGVAYASRHYPEHFPLMVKLLDVRDRISIQVHPDDEYGYRIEQESGKTEAWYILEAEENAQIVFGLKENVTKEQFKQAVVSGTVLDTLRFVPVKAGDMILVPAGTVHALLDGLLLYEIQQDSDTTYRVYDYNRIGTDGKLRELCVDKALEVIRFGRQQDLEFTRTHLECPHFTLDQQTIAEEKTEQTEGRFAIYCIVAGSGEIIYETMTETVRPGDTVLIPACLGEYTIKGNGDMKVLKVK